MQPVQPASPVGASGGDGFMVRKAFRWVWGLGFRVEGFRVEGSGFVAEGLLWFRG